MSEELVEAILNAAKEMICEMMALNNAKLLKGIVTTLIGLEQLDQKDRIELLNKIKDEVEQAEKKLNEKKVEEKEND